MLQFSARGAIARLHATTSSLRAQGATEYLVLLAVVLIIALVSVALLGFFPGAAADTQLTESQIYWRSASPLSITEIDAYGSGSASYSSMYIRIRNNGNYPIRLSKIVGAGNSITQYVNQQAPFVYTYENLNQIVIQPGEETCFGRASLPNNACMEHSILFSVSASDSFTLKALAPGCSADGTGILTIKDFGFEYTVSIDGATVTKKQVGAKPLLARCLGVCTDAGFGTCT